jgi:teichuronic acid biosynthesis glycosyltransferase TuaG
LKNTTVSIITPSYNSSLFIKECITSVQNQSYTNWEMLVVDDASKDNSVEIIQSFMKNDSRIKLIALDENVGAAQARNKALEKAQGQFIAFLDSDDLWMSDKLSKQLQFMSSTKCAFSFTAYQPLSEDGKQKFSIIEVPQEISYHSYLKNTIIGCLTVMIDKQQTGDFRMPNIRSSHDMALWLDIMKRGFLAHGINESLAYYRLVSNSNTSKKWKAATEVWDVYRKVENLNIVYSAFCFVGYVFHALKKRLN